MNDTPQTSIVPHGGASSTGAHRLAFIDTLRALACIWVLLVHVHAYWLDNIRVHGWNLSTFLVRFAGYGGKGVDLFIVLSGFCLYWPLVSKSQETSPIEVGKFYKRRAWRILPVYYVALAICTLLAILPGVQPLIVPHRPEASDILLHLFFLQTLFGRAGTINGSFWTLCLEIQLYLTFPLLLLIRRRFSMSAVVIFGSCVAMVWQLLHRAFATPGNFFDGSWTLQLPAYWMEFICGMVAATWLAHPRPVYVRIAAVVFVITCPLILALQPLGNPVVVGVNALCGMMGASIIILLGSLPHPWFSDKMRLGLLSQIGAISYSLYVIHQPMLLVMAPLVRPFEHSIVLTFAIFLVIALPILILTAAAFYTIVEKPSMERSRRVRMSAARTDRGFTAPPKPNFPAPDAEASPVLTNAAEA